MNEKEITEYQIEFVNKENQTYAYKTENPKKAASAYKDVKKQLEKDESVEITKRNVTYGPWETIEKEVNYSESRKNWNHDPFSHFIHKELYDRRDFNAEDFLKKCRQHNAQVIEYFSNRPNNLLILENNSWEELCSFLEKSIPNRNVSNE